MPDWVLEERYTAPVAGMDEAGRGPWAGPVVAACVILPRDGLPAGINDSKKLSHAQREQLFGKLQTIAQIGIGQASVEEIDQLNILAATKLAMQRAVAALPIMPNMVLVDGNQRLPLPCPLETVVKGDSLSLSIAAASIIAKVTRDRIMMELAREYPHYGWERNAGYGTALHQQGLAEHGISPHHRRSFAPVRKVLERVAMEVSL